MTAERLRNILCVLNTHEIFKDYEPFQAKLPKLLILTFRVKIRKMCVNK